MGMTMKVAIKSTLKQGLSFMETIGDVPLLSLHKVRVQMGKNGLGISRELKSLLVQALRIENERYKKEIGKKWYCVTANSLNRVIEMVQKALAKINKDAVNSLEGSDELKKAVQKDLEMAAETNLQTIKDWFAEHYDALLYDTEGHVPWPIINHLQKCLDVWAKTQANPFGEEIENSIIAVAREQGIETNDAADAWVRMGGRLYTPAKTEED